MPPVPNRLPGAATLFFHAAIGRSWGEEAPSDREKLRRCNLQPVPDRRSSPWPVEHPYGCSGTGLAAARGGGATPNLCVPRAEKAGGWDVPPCTGTGRAGGDSRSPAGCGGGWGPPGCALGPAAAPAALPGLPGLGARRSLAGSGRSRDGGGGTTTTSGGGGTCGGKAGARRPALRPSPGPA